MKSLNNLINSFILNTPVFHLDDKLYFEVINFTTTIPFSDLKDFSEDQLKEAEGVLFGEISERYSIDYHKSYIKFVKEVQKELIRDFNSRRAIIKFVSDPELTQPCLISLQFIIRDTKLNVIANLRSSELRDFLPYDLCLIKMITEEINSKLKLRIGNVYINAASAHVYV